MTARLTTLLLLGWFAACSADDTSSADAPDDASGDDAATATDLGAAGASGICSDDPRAEQYEAGMGKRTESGLKVVLVEAEPEPPARLDNSWVLLVEDSEGEPVEDAQLTLNPQMPDHGHGSPREAVVEELGDGQYRAEPIALIMPGYWTIEVSIALADEAPESVQFGFCVQ